MSNILIYISHIFQGKEENKADIERIIRELVKEEPEHTYISPVHTFGFMYKDKEILYDDGLAMCLKLLSRCDRMYVYGDYTGSQGVKAEIRYCKENAIPYEIR